MTLTFKASRVIDEKKNGIKTHGKPTRGKKKVKKKEAESAKVCQIMIQNNSYKSTDFLEIKQKQKQIP